MNHSLEINLFLFCPVKRQSTGHFVFSAGFSAAVDFLPQLAGVAAVIVLHLWKRNNLLSIAGGTAVYMVLLRLL